MVANISEKEKFLNQFFYLKSKTFVVIYFVQVFRSLLLKACDASRAGEPWRGCLSSIDRLFIIIDRLIIQDTPEVLLTKGL